MLDIHCHILPAVDDGPQTLDESLAMIKRVAREGVTHIVATPHCNLNLPLFRDAILPRVESLNEEVRRRNLGVTILPGSEIALFDLDVFRDNFEAGRFCHLGDRPAYSLLEFPWRNEEVPRDAEELVVWLRLRGTQPIIAHPERTPFLRENRAALNALVEAGAWLQVTVDSLLGGMSPTARTVGEEIVTFYSNVVLASDAHGLHRCSGLEAGYKRVRELCGRAREADLRARANEVLRCITASN